MGIRIDVDASGAIKSLTDFRQALNDSGATAKLTDSQLASLADRFRDKLQADKAAAQLAATQKQIETIGKAAGLSQQEISKLSQQLGVAAKSSQDLSSSFSSLSTSSAAMGPSIASIAMGIGSLVTAYISLREVASFVSSSVLDAARYQTLGVVIKQVGQNAGYTSDQMTGFADGIQKAGISMIESRQSLAKMAQSQLDLSKATDLARVAQGAAIIANTNSSDAFGRLIQGITTGQSIILHHMGIMVNMEDVYSEYAASLGISSKALSEHQKREAALQAVIAYGSRTAGLYEESMKTAGKQVQSFTRYISDLKVVVGEPFLDSFTSTVFSYGEAIEKIKEVLSTPDAKEGIANLADAVAKFANTVAEKLPEAIKTLSELINIMANARQKLPEYFGVFGDAAVGAYDALSGNGKQFDQYNKNLKAIYDAKRKESSLPESSEKSAIQASIEAWTKGLDQIVEKEKNFHALDNFKSNTVPTNEDKKAVDDYWAHWKKGELEYKELTESSLKYERDNLKYMPYDYQKQKVSEDYNSFSAKINKGIDDAKSLGRWDDVEKLERAATAAANEYLAKIREIEKAANQENEAQKSYYDNMIGTIEQMKDSLMGGSGSNEARVDKYFRKVFDDLEKAALNAKGSLDGIRKSQEDAKLDYPWLKALARIRDTINELQKYGSLLQELGSATNSPSLSFAGTVASTDSWRLNAQMQVKSWGLDEQKTIQLLQDIQAAYDSKLVQGRVRAYESVKAVSERYWQAERAAITDQLSQVKKEADDETAYKIYAAQQWDAYNKKTLERQAQYAGSFGETFAAKWSLAFGSYKDEMTKAHEDWESFSDSVIDLAKGMGDAIAGSWGDAIRNILSGKGNIQDLGKNMVSRMVDSLAGFVEKSMKQSWNDMLGQLFGGQATAFGQKEQGISAQAASVTASSADMSISSATINVSSATMQSQQGQQTVQGGSGLDTLQNDASTFGSSAGDSFLSTVKTTVRQNNGILFSSQELETLQGASSAIWKMNNNPGNITSKSGGFASYPDMQTGLTSLADYLKRRIDQGFNTIDKLKDVYAEGSTTWSGNVSRASGLDNNIVISSQNTDQLRQLIRGVTVAEGSSSAINEDMISDAIKKGVPDLSAINSLKGLHLEKLDSTFATQLGQAAQEFKEVTGRNLSLTDGFRTYAQQAELFARKGSEWAAAPGKSMHEFGQAVDVASQDVEDFGKIAQKYGLQSLKQAGLKNEPWHYQLDDTYGNQASVRNGTFISKWANNTSNSVIPKVELASSQVDTISEQFGKIGGQTFFDSYYQKTLQNDVGSTNPYQSGYNGISLGTWDTDAILSGSGQSSLSGINWNRIGTVIGGLSQIGMGAATGNVGSMIGGGLSTAGSIVNTFGTAMGMSSSLASTLGGGLGIVGTLASVVATLLTNTSKTEKTGSGYNVAINAGKVQLAGVDFYRTTTTSGYNTSTSHTASPGMTDPDVGREISVYLRDSAKNLKTFAKELGISTSALKDFSAPMVTITKDSISSYERNMSNLQAQFVLSAEGLRGAFDAVAEDYEIYVDEFKRLGEALKTVGGYTEAYGYDLYTMAGITDTAIKAIRDYNVESYQTAKDTYSQILPLIGATADQIQSVMDTLEDQAKEAAAVTDAQYAKILEADYASKLEEAVGGEDAFKQVMENLIKNVLDSIESYSAQAEYYTKKANSAISDLNAPGVTIENFWDAFSQAMKSALSPDQFELWADASSWVNNLNTMNDAIEAWNENIKKVTATLQSREQSSIGNSRLAEITSLASTQEQELYEARKNNYDQATIDYIIEVQRLELAKKYADLDQDEYQKQQDLYARMATASDLSEQSTLISKYAAAEKELYEARSEGYSEATMALLEATQSAELAKTLSDNLKDVQNKIQSFQSKWADLTSREYAANKDDVMSGYTALQSQQAAEILQAYQDGMSQEYIDKLKEVQSDELAKKWKDLNLSKLQDDLSDVKDDLDKIVNKFQEAMDSITTLIDTELSNVKSLAASADSTNSSIASTLKDLTSGSDSPLNASQKAASLYYQIATAYGTMISANASTASTSGGLDTTGLSGSQSASSLGGLFSTASSTMYSASGAAKTAAAQTISDLAGDYLSALKSSLGDSAAFYDKYIDVLTALKQAQSITGSEKSYETTIADALTAEQTILSDILKEIQKGSDASTAKIQALLQSSQAISSSMSGLYDDTVNNQTSWRTTVTNLLQQAGYSSDDITAALGGPTSTSSFLARLNEFNQTTMPTYIQSILDLLTQLINIQGQINTETPIATQPTTGSSYTQDEINWATNVRSAMNYENYGGSSSWTVDQVLKNLATYASWANAYGVSSTNAFTVPTNGSSNYFYQEAAAFNKANSTTKTYLDMQNSVATGFGSNANYLAHWLGYGYNEGITFPTDDYVMSQTAKYYFAKWQRDGGAASGYSTPLAEATYIEQNMLGSASWTTSALEAAAKAHYDAYGKTEGLIKPYALGGLIDSPLALVGEIGPEIIASPGATVTPAAITQNLFGEAFAALSKEVRELRTQLYAVMRAVAYNTQQTQKTIEKWDTEGTPAVAS